MVAGVPEGCADGAQVPASADPLKTDLLYASLLVAYNGPASKGTGNSEPRVVPPRREPWQQGWVGQAQGSSTRAREPVESTHGRAIARYAIRRVCRPLVADGQVGNQRPEKIKGRWNGLGQPVEPRCKLESRRKRRTAELRRGMPFWHFCRSGTMNCRKRTLSALVGEVSRVAPRVTHQSRLMKPSKREIPLEGGAAGPKNPLLAKVTWFNSRDIIRRPTINRSWGLDTQQSTVMMGLGLGEHGWASPAAGPALGGPARHLVRFHCMRLLVASDESYELESGGPIWARNPSLRAIWRADEALQLGCGGVWAVEGSGLVVREGSWVTRHCC